MVFFLESALETQFFITIVLCMSTQIVNIEQVSVIVSWKSIKNIYLKVKPITGEVTMSCPQRTTFQQVFSYLESKLDWIKKKQKKVALLPVGPILQYVNGEQHYYLGELYALQIIESEQFKVCVVEDKLEVHVPANTKATQIAALLQHFYAKSLEPILQELLLLHTPIMKLAMPTFSVKWMKKIWAYCRHKKRALCFNLLLCKKPKECIELSVVHELSHLFVPNHSKKFYAVLSKFMPDWKERHVKLHSLPF